MTRASVTALRLLRTGHLLGAAGAVEAIFALLALVHGVAPPTVNLATPAPDLPGIALLRHGAGQALRSFNTRRRAVLTNSFGFGGTNVALVFGSV